MKFNIKLICKYNIEYYIIKIIYQLFTVIIKILLNLKINF